eukprot:COSAG02_NODE_451_length_22060_cov_6.853513_2_plen_133_part_00
MRTNNNELLLKRCVQCHTYGTAYFNMQYYSTVCELESMNALIESCVWVTAASTRRGGESRAVTSMVLRPFSVLLLLQAQLGPLSGLEGALQQPAPRFPKRAVYPQPDPELCVVLISKLAGARAPHAATQAAD